MKQKTVLIIEDQAFMRDLLRRIFEDIGFKVIGEAKDGRQGIIQYFELKPDLVTMDINMPEKNGIVATTDILSKDSKAKIIMISSYSEESVKKHISQLSLVSYIQKPFQPILLLKTIDNTFGEGTVSKGLKETKERKEFEESQKKINETKAIKLDELNVIELNENVVFERNKILNEDKSTNTEDFESKLRLVEQVEEDQKIKNKQDAQNQIDEDKKKQDAKKKKEEVQQLPNQKNNSVQDKSKKMNFNFDVSSFSNAVEPVIKEEPKPVIIEPITIKPVIKEEPKPVIIEPVIKEEPNKKKAYLQPRVSRKVVNNKGSIPEKTSNNSSEDVFSFDKASEFNPLPKDSSFDFEKASEFNPVTKNNVDNDSEKKLVDKEPLIIQNKGISSKEEIKDNVTVLLAEEEYKIESVKYDKKLESASLPQDIIFDLDEPDLPKHEEETQDIIFDLDEPDVPKHEEETQDIVFDLDEPDVPKHEVKNIETVEKAEVEYPEINDFDSFYNNQRKNSKTKSLDTNENVNYSENIVPIIKETISQQEQRAYIEEQEYLRQEEERKEEESRRYQQEYNNKETLSQEEKERQYEQQFYKQSVDSNTKQEDIATYKTDNDTLSQDEYIEKPSIIPSSYNNHNKRQVFDTIDEEEPVFNYEMDIYEEGKYDTKVSFFSKINNFVMGTAEKIANLFSKKK